MKKYIQLNPDKDNLIKIDLGCGSNKKEGYYGIDRLNLEGVDYVADIEEGLDMIPDHSVDEYFTSHFLEHTENFVFVMKEIHRTLKIDGMVKIIVPHFSNPYFYSDYTHKRFFGLYSFDYLSKRDSRFKRGVPLYGDALFEVEMRKLIFKAPVFPFLNLIKKHIIQRFFNLSPYFQEVYEGLFTKVFACSEIQYNLRPIKRSPSSGITI
jgi:hypothetical protein